MFKVLEKTGVPTSFFKAAQMHLSTIEQISSGFIGLPGERFLSDFVKIFQIVGSPIFVNLDHNVSGSPIHEAKKVVQELETIVSSTAGYVFGYKMNFQSLLTFLIAGLPEFVAKIKSLYRESCKSSFGVKVDPIVWLDQKLGDIPSTNFQASDILYKLGFHAVHVLPQVGPDSVAAVQIAAEKNEKAGVIHVVNMTHEGYKYAENEYFRIGETIHKLRRNSLGSLRFPVRINNDISNIKIKAVGVIEPANRPYELFEGYTTVYGKQCLIISIGIGPQGALPGCSLYAGATCEGIGRFIYRGEGGVDKPLNMTQKAKLSRHCALLALSARYAGEPYPLEEILQILGAFNPRIDGKTKDGLQNVYEKIKGRGLF
jgi:orotidine-5'-phosphate decarboxylase